MLKHKYFMVHRNQKKTKKNFIDLIGKNHEEEIRINDETFF